MPKGNTPIPLLGVRAGSKGEKPNLWSCRTAAERSGMCCAVTELLRSLAARGRQRHITKWPLCYRTAPRAPRTSMVKVWVGMSNLI
ncbi:trans-sialidase, putative [Trypanosoma cruzi]|nr:trans-sialidase, putative [Trypanosoma cruzi]